MQCRCFISWHVGLGFSPPSILTSLVVPAQLLWDKIFLRVFRAFSARRSLVGKIVGIITLCGLIVLQLLCGTLHVLDSKGLTNRDRKHVTSQSQTDDAAAAFWKKGCCSMQRDSLCLVKINVVKTVRDIRYCPCLYENIHPFSPQVKSSPLSVMLQEP